MAKIKFHKVAAIVVLLATSAWIATGEFASVGSASAEAEEKQAQAAEAPAREVALKTVQVAVPPRLEHARTIRVSGYTAPDKKSVLAARSSGIVEELTVEKGQHVEEGEVILKLQTEGKESALASAKQALAQREAEASAAERLSKSGNIARLQLDAARSALASARSAVEAAQADLDRVIVKAPFAGLIDSVPVETGSSIMQGSEVATLLKLDPMLAIGEVSERDLGTIKSGDKARVRLVNGRDLDGTIRYVSREASPQTRTFQVEVAIDNKAGTIPAGMTAEISILSESVETVALPRSVVTLSNDGDLGIRAVGEEDLVSFYPIDIVDDTPGALYLAGIPENARVIVAGQDLVRDGEKVNAVDADPELIRKLAGSLAEQAVQ
ncbi:efflux RND transporter periplasmic adaptor subunit [Nitratireductor basaltis]|uniref:Efflux transporter, RND family, MFP subunit n=1 Tax=Nitratireductor basaltis TaxID=472175 RepID=A0A084U712_9HYPH|nr:efflux RND transporter periplasmic adaptor subunit [Nitratireductor basaltis]KFB08748.1 Efflux transporter, RND family, MFP subunit precursor [Nitratireductor basaltis]